MHRHHAICGREASCLLSQDSSGGQIWVRSNGIAYFVCLHSSLVQQVQASDRRASGLGPRTTLVIFFLQ